MARIVLREFQMKLEKGVQPLEMPKGSQVLCVAAKGQGLVRDLVLCAFVTVGVEEKEKRMFLVLPTGSAVQQGAMKHVGSAAMGEGPVMHVFEVILGGQS